MLARQRGSTDPSEDQGRVARSENVIWPIFEVHVALDDLVPIFGSTLSGQHLAHVLELTTFTHHDLEGVRRQEVGEGHAEQSQSEVEVQMVLVKHHLEEIGERPTGVRRQGDAEHGQADQRNQERLVRVERLSEGPALGEDGRQDQILVRRDDEDDGRLPAENDLGLADGGLQLDVPRHRF